MYQDGAAGFREHRLRRGYDMLHGEAVAGHHLELPVRSIAWLGQRSPQLYREAALASTLEKIVDPILLLSAPLAGRACARRPRPRPVRCIAIAEASPPGKRAEREYAEPDDLDARSRGGLS